MTPINTSQAFSPGASDCAETASGFDTTARLALSLAVQLIASAAAIACETGHRCDAVVGMYVCDAEIFSGNAPGALL